jgi:hypothetical protein
MKAQISPQETGIVGSNNSGAVFGPANRDHYNPSDWALIAPDASAVEIIPDLDVLDRMRNPREPAIIKPAHIADNLPALLTILAQIPLAARILTQAGHQAADYGRDSSWWTGTAIEIPETIDIEEDRGSKEERDLIHETQRIMAFLLNTDRLYGSAEPLVNLPALATVDSLRQDVPGAKEEIVLKPNGNYDRFVIAWSHAVKAYENSEEAYKLFRTTALYEDGVIPFYTMYIPLGQTTGAEPVTLYDAVDDLIWAKDVDGTEPEQVFLTEIPHVLILRVVRNNFESIDIDIPSEFYLDRYVADNMSAAKEMRKSMAECRRQIRDLESQSKKLESPTGTTASSSDLLASAIEYLRKGTSTNIRHQFSEMDDGENHADAEDEDEEDETSHDQIEYDAKAIRIADTLEKIHQNLSEKLRGAFSYSRIFHIESSITDS